MHTRVVARKTFQSTVRALVCLLFILARPKDRGGKVWNLLFVTRLTYLLVSLALTRDSSPSRHGAFLSFLFIASAGDTSRDRFIARLQTMAATGGTGQDGDIKFKEGAEEIYRACTRVGGGVCFKFINLFIPINFKSTELTRRARATVYARRGDAKISFSFTCEKKKNSPS